MVRVSIIIPCYNRESLLPATLDSVVKQSYSDWEAIVVDDGSSDRSLEVANDYARRDRRIVAFHRQNSTKGGNICRNEGLGRARGRYVIFLDSDNLLHPSCLAARVAAMERAPENQFGVFQTEVFDSVIGDRGILCNRFDDSNDLLRLLSFDHVWHTAGPIWSVDAVRALGGFDPALPSFQEWDLHVRALTARLKYFKMSIRDHYYRMGERDTERIGRYSVTDPRHLRSHERLFQKTVAVLRGAGRMDEPIRRRVAGLFWWLATRYRVVITAAEACQVWRKAYELKIIRRQEMLGGMLFIQMARLRGGRHLGRPIQTFWPREYFKFFSPTLMTTPVSSLDGRIYWSR